MTITTERFSDRVANYIKYRPSYPRAIVDIIISECQLFNEASIADIGSGTGIFSKLMLDRNYHVIGVEPNENMRKAAERHLVSYEKFSSVDGQSECTNLADCSIDLITVAQAFHWFNREATKQEFLRILKPGGYLALLWNQRKIDTPLLQEYEDILCKYGTDYQSVNHMNLLDEDIEGFFNPARVNTSVVPNSQQFDLAGFLGRIQSSSYTPKAGTGEHATLMKVAEALFDRYEYNGVITFEYDTRLYLAQIFHE